MDAYNRTNSDVGTYGLKLTGTGIGDATVSTSLGDNTTGFFAQSYTLAGGKTIISYRGTDQIWTQNGIGGDLINGWFVGAGVYDTPQARLAAQFYQDINGSTAGNNNITLTGHSLGGGLAGLVGDIYGVKAVMFDNMPFELAATHLYDATRLREHFDSSGNSLGTYTDDPEARQHYYADAEPHALDPSKLKGIAVSGEVLAPFRISQSTPVLTLTSTLRVPAATT
jgi:hypothetical protein